MKYYEEISNIMNAFQKLRIRKALKTPSKGSFQSSKRMSPSRVSLDSSMNQSSFHKSTGTKSKIKNIYKLKQSKICKKPVTQNITRNKSWIKREKDEVLKSKTQSVYPKTSNKNYRDASVKKNVYERLYENSSSKRSSVNNRSECISSRSPPRDSGYKSEYYIYNRLSKEFSSALEDIREYTPPDYEQYKEFTNAVKQHVGHERYYEIRKQEIDLNTFVFLMIKLGFVVKTSIVPSSCKNESQLIFNDKDNSSKPKKRLFTMRKFSYRVRQTNDNDQAKSNEEAELWAQVWINLQGHINGYITERNLKLYLAAICNLWSSWHKANEKSKINRFKGRVNSISTNGNVQTLFKNNEYDDSVESWGSFSQRLKSPNR